MKIYFHYEKTGNFGDDLNGWLWNRFFPQNFFDDNEHVAFIGIGTLLGTGALSGTSRAERRIVFGSGSGYAKSIDLDQTWDIRFVRGPRTARTFGLPIDRAITDPAALVYLLRAEFESLLPKSPAYFPHHSSLKLGDWEEVCALAGFKFIDARSSGHEIMRSILSSSVVLTEAMHGAIVADALRVPWIPVRSANYILDFKWQDWAESIGVPIAFQEIDGIYRPLSSYPLAVQVKNEIKRVASALGIPPPSVIRPIKGSLKGDVERAASKLLTISTTQEGILSSHQTLTSKIDQILCEIDRLVREYS